MRECNGEAAVACYGSSTRVAHRDGCSVLLDLVPPAACSSPPSPHLRPVGSSNPFFSFFAVVDRRPGAGLYLQFN